MPQPIDTEARAKLADFVERLEALAQDRRVTAAAQREVFKEAESYGFDKKALRTAVKLLNVGPEERAALTDVASFYVDVVSQNETA
jgi:Uncharacterized protein conserved in bacteria